MAIKPSTNSESREPKQSIADWVGEELKRHIASGEFAPGDRLPGERQLSEALSVSRVSVRSALQNLKAQGLLSSVQGGGTHVVAQDPSMDRPLLHLIGSDAGSLHDLLELIGHVASFGAQRAARLVNEADVQDMKAIVETMQLSGRSPSLQSTDDVKFHALLARASQSGVFMHIMSVLQDTLSAALTAQGTRNLPTREEAMGLRDLNLDMIAALESRDENRAGLVAQQHAEARREVLSRIFPTAAKRPSSATAAE